MIDGTRIGQLAAEVMEQAEKTAVEEGETVSIGTVAIVVEVNVDEADGPGYTHVFYRCSDSRRWIQSAFFDQAQRSVYEDES